MGRMEITIKQGDCLKILKTLPTESVHCCVTSPPYWGLRDYGVAGQIGLEKTPNECVAKLIEVFREVKRVLRSDGTLWCNLGDCYAASSYGSGGGWAKDPDQYDSPPSQSRSLFKDPGFKHDVKSKDLIGFPWRVAFALQADGWYLRSDIIWHKPNPMPESVTDRPTKAHEYLFLLAKSARYHYDIDAIREPANGDPNAPRNRWDTKDYIVPGQKSQKRLSRQRANAKPGRNKRTVWTIATMPCPEAHFATYPPDLIEPCILAGCPPGGVVLDPFAGTGTTGGVAAKHGRNAILIELNPEYIPMIEETVRAYNSQECLFG